MTSADLYRATKKQYRPSASSSSFAGTSKTAAKRQLAKMAETHGYQFTLATYFGSVGNTTEDLQLSIQGGSSGETRSGSQCLVTGVHIKGVLAHPDSANTVRIALLEVDKDWDTSAFTLDLNLTSIAQKGNIKRIYMDKFYTMGTYEDNRIVVDEYRKMGPYGRGFLYKFTGAAGDAFADTVITMLMISDSSAVEHPGFASGYISYTWKNV